MLQTLVRSMPSLRKQLIVASLVERNCPEGEIEYGVEELAMSTEHAPFRHKKVIGVGSNKKTKKPKIDESTDEKG